VEEEEKSGLWLYVSIISLRPIYTEEAYKQEHLIIGHKESYHLIFQMLSAMEGDLADA
jgi:hypothetical protein